MKTKILLLITALSILCSCNRGGYNPYGYVDYLTSEEMQADVDNFVEMAAAVDNIRMEYLLAVLDADKASESDFEKFYDDIERIAQKKDKFCTAAQKLYDSNLLTTDSPSTKGVSLFNKLYAFFTGVADNGKEVRTVLIQNAKPQDYATLFANLPSRYKNGETDAGEWWKKFKKGDYDNQAPRIYQEMYHNAANAVDTDFPVDAPHPNELAHKKGQELVKKGAELNFEVVKTLGGDGVELIENVNKDAELVKKYKNGTLTNKDFNEYVNDRVLKVTDSKEFVDNLKDIRKRAKEKLEDTKEDLPKTDDNRVTVTATDTDNESPGNILVTTNEKGEQKVTVGGKDKGKLETSAPKRSGKTKVTMIDEGGDKHTETVDVKDEDVEVTGSTNEKEQLEERRHPVSSGSLVGNWQRTVANGSEINGVHIESKVFTFMRTYPGEQWWYFTNDEEYYYTIKNGVIYLTQAHDGSKMEYRYDLSKDGKTLTIYMGAYTHTYKKIGKVTLMHSW